MSGWRRLAIPVIVVCIIGIVAAIALAPSDKKPASTREKTEVKGKGVERGKKPRKKAKKRGGRTREEANASKVSEERQKTTFDIDPDDEAVLNEEQRKMIEAIRAALDADDGGRVLKQVQLLQKSKEWPDGIPKSIKKAAIEALAWVGSSSLPELAGFLADADPEIVEMTVEKYEEMLSDVDLSDYELSVILVQAAKVINDAEAMDSMLFELNRMRHSVAVDTIKQLMKVGTEATLSVLPANIEFYTCEEGLDSAAKLDKWLEENPDDEGDEEFYGGSNNDAKPASAKP